MFNQYNTMNDDVSKQKKTGDSNADDRDVPEPIGFRRSILYGNEAHGFLRNYYGYFLPGISIILYAILLATAG